MHDLVLFPLYALADLSLRSGLRAMRHFPVPAAAAVPVVNYTRLQVLAAGLTFLMFFPGLIKQGASTYHNATGLTQDPFLDRWLLLVAAMLATSALAYAIRLACRARRHRRASNRPASVSAAPTRANTNSQCHVWFSTPAGMP